MNRKVKPKAGDLVKFKSDGELMLITSVERHRGVVSGQFVAGHRAGKGVTTYTSLIEEAYESR